jgi:surface protein
MSFPPPITALKLVVSTGTSPNVQTFEQNILPSELSGTTTNRVLINDSMVNAILSQPLGTPVSSSIVTTYDGFPSDSNTLSSNSTSNFIPRVLSLANISNKLTTDSPFSLSGLISTVSTGNLSYSSSNQSVATVSTTGLVTIVGEGTTTITVNQVADATYGAASASKTFAVARPPLISLLANGVTIRHTGLVTDVPSSTPLFIQANPRERVTGPEWFAVIKQDSTPFINAYAKSNSSSFFTPLGETMPVIYDNIVTTHITDMYGLFYEVGVFTHKVSSWDTSKVTNMFRAFWESGFNSEINDWDVSNVTFMTLLFRDNGHFNKPLNKWNTSKVTNMEGMFQNCSFNQDISSWNTSNVTNMNYMFNGASAFNQPIGSWDTSKVTNMNNMFSSATCSINS